jgi:hypothetical protein
VKVKVSGTHYSKNGRFNQEKRLILCKKKIIIWLANGLEPLQKTDSVYNIPHVEAWQNWLKLHELKHKHVI